MCYGIVAYGRWECIHYVETGKWGIALIIGVLPMTSVSQCTYCDIYIQYILWYIKHSMWPHAPCHGYIVNYLGRVHRKGILYCIRFSTPYQNPKSAVFTRTGKFMSNAIWKSTRRLCANILAINVTCILKSTKQCKVLYSTSAAVQYCPIESVNWY